MFTLRKAAWAILLAQVALAPAFAGSPPRFQVEAFRCPDAGVQGLSYRINESGKTGDLELPVLTPLVRAALSSRGMFEAPPGVVPDFEVSVGFEMLSRSEVADEVTSRFRRVTHRIRTIDVRMMQADGKAIVSQQRVAVPVEHSNLIPGESIPMKTVFTKSLMIAARRVADAEEGAARAELWRVHVQNCDTQSDARLYASLMMAAAMDHIGTRTESRQEIAMPQTDKRVAFVQTKS